MAKTKAKAGGAAAAAAAGGPAPWTIKGELILNCNCTVFCPCVVSLGQHPPTEGSCKAWLGVRIDDGRAGDTSLGGLNVAMLLDIPGRMADGDWKAALYLDARATEAQGAALEAIFTGRAKGATGLFRMLVSTWLGVGREDIAFETDGRLRRLSVGRKIVGAVEPVAGADPGADLRVVNTGYWMGPDVTVARAAQGRVRDFGRVWNLEGRSAEICAIRWTGP
jgi:hypothetical protein